MGFIEYWQDTREHLDDELTTQIPELFSAFSTRQRATVQQIIKHGKRIRGCLVCLVSQALGGRVEDALPRAVAIECIQAASLVHDDYVDDDVCRRKGPATWTVEGPRRAVLLGDVMFATAIQSMVELSNADGIVVARAIATLATGAYQELLLLAQPNDGGMETHGPDVYERIIYFKTGALFGAACQLGAIGAGAPEEVGRSAYAFGARIGEAYQIADDLTEIVTAWHSPEKLIEKPPALLPAWHFLARKSGPPLPRGLAEPREEADDWRRYMDQALIRGMEQEIDQRVRAAESQLGRFPVNYYREILREAPARIAALTLSSVTADSVAQSPFNRA